MQIVPTTPQAINKILQNSNSTQSLHTRQRPFDEHLILVHWKQQKQKPYRIFTPCDWNEVYNLANFKLFPNLELNQPFRFYVCRFTSKQPLSPDRNINISIPEFTLVITRSRQHNPSGSPQSRAVYLELDWLVLRDLALEIHVNRLSTATLSAIAVKEMQRQWICNWVYKVIRRFLY